MKCEQSEATGEDGLMLEPEPGPSSGESLKAVSKTPDLQPMREHELNHNTRAISVESQEQASQPLISSQISKSHTQGRMTKVHPSE